MLLGHAMECSSGLWGLQIIFTDVALGCHQLSDCFDGPWSVPQPKVHWGAQAATPPEELT